MLSTLRILLPSIDSDKRRAGGSNTMPVGTIRFRGGPGSLVRFSFHDKTWWAATVLPRALRLKRPLHRCNACNPRRTALEVVHGRLDPLNRLPTQAYLMATFGYPSSERKRENSNPTPFRASPLATGAGAPVRLRFHGGEHVNRTRCHTARNAFQAHPFTIGAYSPLVPAVGVEPTHDRV